MTSSFKALMIGIRPPTLLVGLTPILIGLAFGFKELAGTYTSLEIAMAIGAIIFVLLMQSGANLVNDVKDADSGVDSSREGPMRVVTAGLLSKEQVKFAYKVCFGISFVLISIFTAKVGILLFILGILGIASAYFYTSGPRPLAYYALGELIALLFFGPIAVAGTAMLLIGDWDNDIALWGLGPGFFAASLMAVNNYRDRISDAKAGKKTLANILPEPVAVKLPLVFQLTALGILCSYSFEMGLGSQLTIPILLLLFFVVFLISPRIKPDSAVISLVSALKLTAALTFLYGLVFTATVLL